MGFVSLAGFSLVSFLFFKIIEKIIKCDNVHLEVSLEWSVVLLNAFLKILFKSVKKKLARRMKSSIIVFVESELNASAKQETLDLKLVIKLFKD